MSCSLVLGCVSISARLAAETTLCVAVELSGIDPQLQDDFLLQLKNELNVPLLGISSARDCKLLRIEMEGLFARIFLKGHDVLEVSLNLNGILEELRPRAVALSAAGLLELDRNPVSQTVERTPSDKNAPLDNGKEANHNVPSTSSTKTNPTVAPKVSAADTPTKKLLRFYLKLLGGGRAAFQFPAWITEAEIGFGIRAGAFHPELSIVGAWGGKSEDKGEIHIAGVGVELVLNLRLIERRRFALFLGPAAQVLCVWGYDRDTASHVSGYHASAPVLDILAVLSGTFAISSRIGICLALGGGYTPLYFIAKADHQEIIGLSGGFLTAAAGVDFGL